MNRLIACSALQSCKVKIQQQVPNVDPTRIDGVPKVDLELSGT